MRGALFGAFGTPIDNDTAVPFDGPGGVALTYSCCRLLMGVEDGPVDAPCWDDSPTTVDLTYAAPQEGGTVSDAHMAHLVAVADCDGRIAFFGHTSAAIEAAISQVLGFAGGGAA